MVMPFAFLLSRLSARVDAVLAFDAQCKGAAQRHRHETNLLVCHIAMLLWMRTPAHRTGGVCFWLSRCTSILVAQQGFDGAGKSQWPVGCVPVIRNFPDFLWTQPNPSGLLGVRTRCVAVACPKTMLNVLRGWLGAGVEQASLVSRPLGWL